MHVYGPFDARRTVSRPGFQRLLLSNPGEVAVFLLFVGSAPSLYGVNVDPAAPPPGTFTATTVNNSLPLLEDWMGQGIYVANVSSLAAQGSVVSLLDL